MAAGGFTLPTEVGYEELTLALADKWGADVIRDSNGTKLPPSILDSGLDIYSTLCLIREDNAWAKAHPDLLQQNFLMSEPATAATDVLSVDLLAGFSTDQFRVNDSDGLEFWQVFNRTTGAEVESSSWSLKPAGLVEIRNAEIGHVYTVNFLAVRLWEEISMYNHVTNDWGDAERLMAVEPRYPAVAAHLLAWLDAWCRDNPATTVVRFTSLFYNFAWFWGSDPERPHLYSDWGSYDFTVTPLALRQFEQQTGTRITSEDFVNAGRYTSTHNPPSEIYRRWIDFVGEFVRDLGRRCVDIVHAHGKKAMVFHDDSWIGLEPYSGHFQEFGFDGIIKAVFSGYETRLCAGVATNTHEIRLHPYLFPVNLEGRPTFAEGGTPTADLLGYWRHVRRAALRAPIERIGLGGYLSLVEPFPDFQDAVAVLAEEHRTILDLHRAGPPEIEPIKVGVLTAWGSLRTWSTSGHLHEHPDLTLTHVLEALAGLPYEVDFVSLTQIEEGGVPAGLDVIINAGTAGSAWSGGSAWSKPSVVAAIRTWAAKGGGFIGIEEPTAAASPLATSFFQLADVLGVDRDTGDRSCVLPRRADAVPSHPLLADGAMPPQAPVRGVHVLGRNVVVAHVVDGTPVATLAPYGAGQAIYLAGISQGAGQARLVDNAILLATGRKRTHPWAEDAAVDVARFARSKTLVLANSSARSVRTLVHSGGDAHEIYLEPGELTIRLDDTF